MTKEQAYAGVTKRLTAQAKRLEAAADRRAEILLYVDVDLAVRRAQEYEVRELRAAAELLRGAAYSASLVGSDR